MKRSSSAFLAIKSGLRKNFELWLTAVGVVMAITLTYSELSREEQGLTLTFLVWLQGIILWAVHRHNWSFRRALARRLRLMLQDRVNTQLTVLIGAAGFSRREGSGFESDMETALEAARMVALELEHLSLESLATWERHYGRFLPSVLC